MTADKTAEAEVSAPVAFEDQEVPRETGELKSDVTCDVHPDQKLQVQETPYGSYTTERCPKCAASDNRKEKAAAKEAAEEATPRQTGS